MKRFFTHVNVGTADECWLWVGAVYPKGYGKVTSNVSGKKLWHGAHRVALSYKLGREVAPGFVVDHLCRTPLCVNPSHLEEVTQRTNVTRGIWGDTWRARAEKTVCKHGHPLMGDNLVVKQHYGSRGILRVCVSCRRARDKVYSARKRIKRKMATGGPESVPK